MIVDKESIKKAKEKLGDLNAYAIAEIQDLAEFDEKNLKALCPHHQEDTPSYVYDKKRHRFKCFGCGYSADIIDAKMGKGATFLEACQYLFQEAKMDYSFGEKDVQTKFHYRYPHPEPLNDRAKVISYLSKRGISKATIDYLDIREDAHGNCVFNYYDVNDCLEVVKYRPSHTIDKTNGEIKNWAQKGADTSPILFNMNRINTENPLLICEGELDCASAIEAGYLNAVSVPFGCNSFGWMEECWDWLEQFDSIIIWSDNDAPGKKMQRECINRLGSWRTRYIDAPPMVKKDNGKEVPCKDINDCLQIGGKDFVIRLITEAKDVPVNSVVDYSDITELNIAEMDGIKTGLKPIDSELVKLFYGTLTILSGRPGSGKTSIVDQAIANTIDDGKCVFLFSKEMPERMTASWMNSILGGRRNTREFTSKDHKPYRAIPRDIQDKIQKYYAGKLFIYKDSDPNDLDSIMNSAEECVRKYGVKLVVIDNMMMVNLGGGHDEEYTNQTEFVKKLINFAAKFNIAVILVAHPKKTPDVNADITMYDVSGSSNIINLAMRAIGLRRVSQREKEKEPDKWGKYDVVLTIMKDRMLGKADTSIGLWYDLESRRFYTDYEEYAHQYKWDTNVYQQPLPYIDRGKRDEFPDK